MNKTIEPGAILDWGHRPICEAKRLVNTSLPMDLCIRSALLFSLWLAAAGCTGSGSVSPPILDETDLVHEPHKPSHGGVACTAPVPVSVPLQLLTRTEIDFTLRDLLGETRELARELLPPENTVLGFENNATAHQISPLFLESMLMLAEQASERVLQEAPERLHACVANANTQGWQISGAERDSCRDTFIEDFTRRAYRRPSQEAETQVLQALFDSLASEPREAFAATVQAALISPRFLYRVQEIGLEERAETPVELNAYEMAERLSYLLWRTMPDEELFALAADGSLLSDETLQSQISRMMRDPKTLDMSHDFHRQWLHLDAFDELRKDLLDDVPNEMQALNDAWRTSLLEFADDAWFGAGAGGVDALLSSPKVWLSPSTAPLYGYEGSAGPVDFPADERAGLITQPALLAMLAHAEQTSPIHRGIFVREKLLCEQLPPPPPDLVITPPSPDPNSTTRERFAAHTEEESCQNCHILIDPIGFGFEGYDALGRFRETENGLPIDDSGELLYTWSQDSALEGPFSGAVQLAHRLADAPQARDCVATQWWRFAFARGEASERDLCSLTHAKDSLRTTGQVTELLETIVLSDAFRKRPGVVRPAPTSPPGPMDPSGPSPTEPAGDVEPQSPRGFVDRVDNSGVVSGWAFDPNSPGYALNLHVYVDGPAGQGQMLPVVQRAQYARPDVNQATGYEGDHGFTFQLPRSLRDGVNHAVYIYGIDTGDSPNILLPGSPVDVLINGGDATPEGHVDNVSENGNVVGWSFDPSEPAQPVELEFYVDAPWYLGESIGNAFTSIARPDVNAAFGVEANAGFQYALPQSVRDGQAHVLFVVARDRQNPDVRVAIGNPISFQVSP